MAEKRFATPAPTIATLYEPTNFSLSTPPDQEKGIREAKGGRANPTELVE